MTAVLRKLSTGLTKFGNGDQSSAPRVMKLIEPAGLAVAVVATGQLGNQQFWSAGSECFDALFRLLGSDAFRKDEEIALSVGEALATYASAYLSYEASVDKSGNEWPAGLDEDFVETLSPPPKVSLIAFFVCSFRLFFH
jgi:hypothetical protein